MLIVTHVFVFLLLLVCFLVWEESVRLVVCLVGHSDIRVMVLISSSGADDWGNVLHYFFVCEWCK